MRIAIRYALRIWMVCLAAALVVAITAVSVASVPTRSDEVPPPGRKTVQVYRRRPLEPNAGRIGEFSGQLLLVALVTLGGRKILRLRL